MKPHSTRFPDTRDSIVRSLASDEPGTRERAYDLIIRAYRSPVVALLERRWSLQRADAEDLAQEFFAQALHKEWLARFDAERGRFRTFLRACLFAFVSTERQAASRLKRGGGAGHVNIDDVLDSMSSADPALDDFFEHEWVRSILALSLDALQQECEAEERSVTFAIFERYDVAGSNSGDRPTYASLAAHFGIPVTQVTNYLHWARRRYRAHVLATLRALAGSEAEYRADVRALLGNDAR